MALSHIAHLCDAVAAALNIPLPHPLMPFTTTECLVSPQYDLTSCFSLSPVIHINDRAAHEPFSWKTINSVNKATADAGRDGPYSRESPSSSSKKEFTAPAASDDKHIVNPAFPQALTLLQADVVSLCMHAGIPPEFLWPPPAMLLNLHELFVLCVKCVKKNSAISSAAAAASTESCGERATALPVVFRRHGGDPLTSLSDRYNTQHTSTREGGAAVAGAETVVQLVSSAVHNGGADDSEDLLYLDRRLSATTDDPEDSTASDRFNYSSVVLGGEEDYDIVERSTYHS